MKGARQEKILEIIEKSEKFFGVEGCSDAFAKNISECYK